MYAKCRTIVHAIVSKRSLVQTVIGTHRSSPQCQGSDVVIYGPRAWVSSTPWKSWPDRSDFKKDKETPGVERIALEKSPGLMNTTQVFPSHQ